VSAVRDKDDACAFVRDCGPGIPDDLLERAFTLRNHPQGGLEARVMWRVSDLESPLH